MKGKGNKHFWNKGVDQGDAFCDTMISQIKQQSEEYP